MENQYVADQRISDADDAGPRQANGTLGTAQVAILIIAAAAPLGAILGTGPIGFIFGNGAGLPGTYLLAAVLMVCFAVGYTALVRALPGEGAFYRYLSVVFGHRIGTGSACVALFAYLMMTTSLAVGSAYFTDYTLSQFGIHIGFEIFVVVYVVVVAILGVMNVDVAAKIIVPLVMLEFGLLLALIVAIAFHKGAHTFPMAAISPSHVFRPGFGISLMIAVASFIGIESAALYTGEARNPSRTVPKATLVAVVLVGLVYFLSLWAFVGDVGWKNLAAIALKGRDSVDMQQNLILTAYGRNISVSLQSAVSLLLCSSNFACYVALHNAATRYVQTLGLHSVLPRSLGVLNKKTHAPSRASLVTTAFVALIVLFIIVAHIDYLSAFAPTYALGSAGVMLLQAAISCATVVYFRKRGSALSPVTFWLPSIGLLGFVFAVVMTTSNYGFLAGSNSTLVCSTPLIFIPIFLFGFLRGAKSIGS
jgi:amino acid transporter